MLDLQDCALCLPHKEKGMAAGIPRACDIQGSPNVGEPDPAQSASRRDVSRELWNLLGEFSFLVGGKLSLGKGGRR